jgi:hypothetical protein
MDPRIFHSTAGRSGSTVESGNGAPSTVARFDTTRPPEGTPADRFVSVCGWCPDLHIMNLPMPADDETHLEAVFIFRYNGLITFQRNGDRLFVSAGICDACRQKLTGV